MTDSMVRLDYAYTTSDAIGPENGISLKEIEAMTDDVARIHQEIHQKRYAGELGFMELPQLDGVVKESISATSERLRSIAGNMVVLGIGGSALGATAVDMALSGAMRHALPKKQDAMRLFVADNSDPRFFVSILDACPMEDTVFNIISKSGSTAETMSQFMVVKELLSRTLGEEEAQRRIVFTTDPESGNLRKIAELEPYQVLSVPPNVGGRFSVLSPVGLLPLACAGHDIEALLKGAASMARRCDTAHILGNPAYLYAVISTLYSRKGRNILVMMPYASDLFGLAQWFGQLWAESLGKAKALDGSTVNLGQTPVSAVGATDQHSQLQLYMEGPQDKLLTFLIPENYGRCQEIPELYQDIEGLSYLGGRGMAELIRAEAKATTAALASQGRPNLTLRLPNISEETLGQLFYMFEMATVMAGGLWNINPMDQPGVELSKKLTYGLMGRKGFEDQAEYINSLDKGDKYLI